LNNSQDYLNSCSIIFYKTVRVSINCIANMLTLQEPCSNSQFLRQNNEQIFKKLRNEFEYLMSKIQTHYRSKRFISQMTIVVRAL